MNNKQFQTYSKLRHLDVQKINEGEHSIEFVTLSQTSEPRKDSQGRVFRAGTQTEDRPKWITSCHAGRYSVSRLKLCTGTIEEV